MKISECLLLLQDCLAGQTKEDAQKLWLAWTTDKRFLDAVSKNRITAPEFMSLFISGLERVITMRIDYNLLYTSLCLSEKTSAEIIEIACNKESNQPYWYICLAAAANNPKTPYSLVRKYILDIANSSINYIGCDALRNEKFIKDIEKEKEFIDIIDQKHGSVSYLKNPGITPKEFEDLLKQEAYFPECIWCRHITPDIMSKYKNRFYLGDLAYNPNTPNNILEEIVKLYQDDIKILRAIAQNTNASPQLLFKIYRSNREDRILCLNLAQNINIPYILAGMLRLNPEYKRLLRENPALPNFT